MSIVDFTTDLFRDPANLRAFIEDGEKSLADAGLPDATPEQVYDLLPSVAESMPAEHPLQTILNAPDPQAALQELDIEHFIEDLESDAHLQGRAKVGDELDAGAADKALGGDQAPAGHHAESDAAGDGAADHVLTVDSIDEGKWKLTTEDDKGLGSATDIGDALAQGDYVTIVDDPRTPEIEVQIHDSDADHAMQEDLHDPEVDHAMWGKSFES